MTGNHQLDHNHSHSHKIDNKTKLIITIFLNAVSLVGIGIYIVYEAVVRFFNPVPINIKIMIPVAAIGLAGNVFSILVLSKNTDRSINMKAAFLHLLYDAISSIAVIIAGV